MSSNVATIERKQSLNLTPQTIDEALRFSELLCKSSIVPKDYQGNPGNCLVAMQWGMELGLQPLQAMQSIAVINGRPAIWGDAMIALVRASGLLESIREEIADDHATCHIKRRGEAETTRTFTVEDAKRAGLWNKQGPWQQYSKRMLQMRARAWALRDVFPDVLRGVHVAEEAQDIPRDVTAEGSAEVAPAAPASRTEQVRAKLANKRQAATLDGVLGSIACAMDKAALDEAAKLAAKLETAADKERAREAYRARKAELERVDTTTGEIADRPPLELDGNAPPVTYAYVADIIAKARSADDLDVGADLIHSIPDEAQRAELDVMARERRAALQA